MSLYTPRQLLLVLLIVAAAGAGLAIDHARRARPDLVERLERLDRVERTEPIDPRSPPATTDTPRAARPAARAVHESRRDRTSSEARRDPASNDASTDGARTHRSRSATPAEPIDINRASEPELVRLPGVGPALAARIVAARPFGDVDELRRVRGVRIALFERLRPFVVALP
jgi:predicted flap endonuclease-1-like 5' DNA nuclease